MASNSNVVLMGASKMSMDMSDEIFIANKYWRERISIMLFRLDHNPLATVFHVMVRNRENQTPKINRILHYMVTNIKWQGFEKNIELSQLKEMKRGDEIIELLAQSILAYSIKRFGLGVKDE